MYTHTHVHTHIHTYMLSLCDPIDYSPPGFSVHGDSPGMNTEVGCHALLQRIFLTQGSNSHLLWLLHWQTDSLPLSHLGRPLLLNKFSHLGKWLINLLK